MADAGVVFRYVGEAPMPSIEVRAATHAFAVSFGATPAIDSVEYGRWVRAPHEVIEEGLRADPRYGRTILEEGVHYQRGEVPEASGQVPVASSQPGAAGGTSEPSPSGSLPFVCPECRKRFDAETSLRGHMTSTGHRAADSSEV